MTASKYAKDEELARLYAQAAYQHTTEDWLSLLGAVQERLAADPALLAKLNNTELSFAERQAQLNALLPSDARSDVKNYLYVLLREGHLNLLNDVMVDLTRLATQGPQARVARISSAIPLTPEEQQALRQRVHKRFGGDVELDFRVDSSLLGGVVVQVGDKIIDGSLAAKLNALHERLATLR